MHSVYMYHAGVRIGVRVLHGSSGVCGECVCMCVVYVCACVCVCVRARACVCAGMCFLLMAL